MSYVLLSPQGARKKKLIQGWGSFSGGVRNAPWLFAEHVNVLWVLRMTLCRQGRKCARGMPFPDILSHRL